MPRSSSAGRVSPTAKTDGGANTTSCCISNTLHKRVVGPGIRAVRVVSEAITEAEQAFRTQNQPLGSFLFLGRALAKTELAKTLAEALFDDEKNLVRIDMSEIY